MADERKKKMTQTMGAYTGDEAAAPGSSGKKKGSGDDEHRGLAAFERGAPAGPPSRGQKGSSRWSGGGASSAPPPKKVDASKPQRDDDDDLRRDRLEARGAPSDDGMVDVSASLWNDSPAPKRRGGKPDRRATVEEEDEDVGEEVEQRPRSNAWKWVLGTLVLAGAGGGAAVVISQAQDTGAATVAAADDKAPTKAAAATHASEDEPDASEEHAEDDDAEATTVADDTGEAAATEPTDAAEATVAVADDAAAPPPRAPTGPADWAPAALALNPWVAIAAAPADRMLGLTPSEAHDNLSSQRTGLWPAAKLMAPQAAYQIGTHEVTWKELALAATIPEVATLTRPKWVPKDAKRRANLPVTGVSWQIAEAFCEGLGGTLPSEAELEWAARGADDRYFPWGRDAVDTNDVHIFAGRPVPVLPVATSKLDKTPEPTVLYDLLGNAQEWTRDAWRPSDPAAADPRSATHKAVRGWPLADQGSRIPAEGSTYRAPACADPSCMATDGALIERVGFRCVHAGS